MFDKHRHQKMIATNRLLRHKQGITGELYYDEWIALCARYQWRCVACGLPRPLVIDHVYPLKLGGSNSIENIQPLCQFCNGNKGATYVDYRDAPFLVKPTLTEDNYVAAAEMYKRHCAKKDIALVLCITQQALNRLLFGDWRRLDKGPF